jgi:putative intracellular protease/amidase
MRRRLAPGYATTRGRYCLERHAPRNWGGSARGVSHPNRPLPGLTPIHSRSVPIESHSHWPGRMGAQIARSPPDPARLHSNGTNIMRVLMILVPSASAPEKEPVLRFTRVIEPYYLFRDNGIEIVVASPSGGAPWRRREDPDVWSSDPIACRFRGDQDAHDVFADTLSLDQVCADDFRAVFCVGELSAIWRRQLSEPSRLIVAAVLASGKPVAIIHETVDISLEAASAGLLILGRGQCTPAMAARALLALLPSSSGPNLEFA